MKDADLEFLNRNECFLCKKLSEYEFSYMAGLQRYLGFPENESAETVIQDGGFCNYHSYTLLKLSNKHHLAGFLIPLANDYINHRISLPDQWQVDCPVCHTLDETAQEYLNQFVNQYTVNEAFHTSFLDSAFLCLPHLQKVLKTNLTAEEKRELLKHEKDCLFQLLDELSRLKNTTYHKAGKNEKYAPIRVIKVLVGRYGTIH